MPKATLADRIKAARKTTGLSQGALARKIGVTRAAVSQWENGTIQTLDMGNLFAVADACDINARWLAMGMGTPVKWVNLSPDEKHLVELFQAMPDDMRDRLLGIAIALQPQSQAPTRAAPFPAHPLKLKK